MSFQRATCLIRKASRKGNIVSDQKVDAELQAIMTLLDALEPLSTEARINVITYVFRRLGIGLPGQPTASAGRAATDVAAVHSEGFEAQVGGVIDIRSFKEEKQPKTASEMVAIVAYYLAHLAPADERRDYIVADDIRRYFVQAVFPLPSAPPHMTLVNAKNAGYVDAHERGQYRLNPVGYNLITNKLPATQARMEKRPTSTRKKAGATKARPRVK
jgi:hypothetical protein